MITGDLVVKGKYSTVKGSNGRGKARTESQGLENRVGVAAVAKVCQTREWKTRLDDPMATAFCLEGIRKLWLKRFLAL